MFFNVVIWGDCIRIGMVFAAEGITVRCVRSSKSWEYGIMKLSLILFDKQRADSSLYSYGESIEYAS